MEKELKVSVASNVIAPANCPKYSEGQCGILYRN